MKNKRPFAPSFIQQLDEHLLLNKPAIWSTRIHLVLYYGGIFLLFLMGVSWLAPNDARNNTNIGVWSTIISIVSLIAIIFWIIYLLRFNVFKRFGAQKRGDAILTFLFYFICIGIFVIAPYIPSYIETVRAQNSYDKKTVYADVNRINTIVCQLEHDSIPLNWSYSIYYKRHPEDSSFIPRKDDNDGEKVPTLLDSNQFQNTIRLADSVVMIYPWKVRVYECPNYQFLSPYNATEKNGLRLLKSIDLYHQVLEHYKSSDKIALQTELKSLTDRYTTNDDARAYNRYYEGYNANDYYGRISHKYSIDQVDDSINNILSKQDRWSEYGWELFLRVFYYITISLTLLVFVFRHSTPKTFFLSLLTAVVLSILTLLMMAISRSDSNFIFVLLLFYYLLFVSIGLATYSTSTRRAVTGIGINLFALFTSFIPLIVVGWYYAIQDGKELYDREPGYYADKQLHFLIAEIAGGVILLLLIEPVFKKLYRKWWAQPED